MQQASLNPKAIEDPAIAGDEEAGLFGDMLEDNSVEETQNEIVTGSMHAEVNAVLGKLNVRESGILRMRYGLDDGQPKTLEDIGLAFNVCFLLLIKMHPMKPHETDVRRDFAARRILGCGFALLSKCA